MGYKKILFGSIIVIVLIVSVFVVSKLISGVDPEHNHDEHGYEAPSHEGHGHEAPSHDEYEHEAPSQDEHEHDGPSHDDHGRKAPSHDEHERESMVQIGEYDIERFGIKIGTAGPGELEVCINLLGVVVINTDRMIHIVPRLSGIVREVKKKLGDKVTKGEILAVIESRELADVKAVYLAAIERLELAQANFSREEKLKEVSTEQDYLNAKQALVEGQIELRSSKQKLISMGFSKDYLEKLPKEANRSLTHFDIIAPFEGTVIKKHIVLGDVLFVGRGSLSEDTEVFVIADLSTVWIDLRAYQKDLVCIKKGQKVIISTKSDALKTKGSIDYVAPIIDEQTRTALVRVVLDNTSGQFRPGSFVTASVLAKKIKAGVVVAKSTLQSLDGKTVVFVQDEDGFKPRPVTLGWFDNDYVEIISGLKPGEKIVIKNSFLLKAELEKDTGGGGDGHGHAH